MLKKEELANPNSCLNRAAEKFVDEDAQRGPHYSHYISKLEAIQLAAEAIEAGDAHHDEVAHEFCDLEGLYGDARKEVLVLVFTEHTWLSNFFYGP